MPRLTPLSNALAFFPSCITLLARVQLAVNENTLHFSTHAAAKPSLPLAALLSLIFELCAEVYICLCGMSTC